ncbi:MAG: hypothetical protein RJA35_109 [Actinomycetota bacterium]|jgi:putative hemolysin
MRNARLLSFGLCLISAASSALSQVGVAHASAVTISPASTATSYSVYGYAELIGATGTSSPATGAKKSAGSKKSAGMANPASVYCVSIGGKVAITDTTAGQAGTCTLPSGKTVDEWTLFRTEAVKLPTWPDGYKVPAVDPDTGVAGCVVIKAADINKQLSMTPKAGRWLLASGQSFPVVLKPVLAHKVGCPK